MPKPKSPGRQSASNDLVGSWSLVTWYLLLRRGRVYYQVRPRAVTRQTSNLDSAISHQPSAIHNPQSTVRSPHLQNPPPATFEVCNHIIRLHRQLGPLPSCINYRFQSNSSSKPSHSFPILLIRIAIQTPIASPCPCLSLPPPVRPLPAPCLEHHALVSTRCRSASSISAKLSPETLLSGFAACALA